MSLNPLLDHICFRSRNGDLTPHPQILGCPLAYIDTATTMIEPAENDEMTKDAAGDSCVSKLEQLQQTWKHAMNG